MRALLLLICLALVTCPSDARIGESLEQCILRFGEVQGVHEGVHAFVQDDYVILCEFDGKTKTCNAITIGTKIELPLTNDEIDLILKENPGDGEWTVEEGYAFPRWKHSSGKWQASFGSSGMLSIRTWFKLLKWESDPRSERTPASW